MDQVYTFKRGSLIEIAFSLINQDTSFNWSGIDIQSSIREGHANGTIVHSFVPYILYSGNSAGIFLTTSGYSTTGWNLNKYYGDVRLEGSGYFGPYHVFDYQINLESSITPVVSTYGSPSIYVPSVGATGPTGSNGWSPVLSIETGINTAYLKVIDWIGSTGTKPASDLYISSTGYSALLAQAINIIGPSGSSGVAGATGPSGANGTIGSDGDDGWSPVFSIESGNDNSYLRVVNWVGGGGTMPATGYYISSTGFVGSINLAVNIRGPSGAQGVAGPAGTGASVGISDVDYSLMGLIETPEVKTYPFCIRSPITGTLEGLDYKLVAGTITGSVKINSSYVSGLENVPITSSLGYSSGYFNNTFAVGDSISIEVAAVASPVDFGFVLRI